MEGPAMLFDICSEGFWDTAIVQIFLLLVIYQFKHFIADFPLQGKYMLGKFKPDWSFFWPLVAHCSVHSAFTLAIVLCFKPEVWWLAIVDGVVHFTMDRIKAGPKYLGRFKDLYSKQFWWSLGIDQMVHHLTHYYIIFMIITG